MHFFLSVEKNNTQWSLLPVDLLLIETLEKGGDLEVFYDIEIWFPCHETEPCHESVEIMFLYLKQWWHKLQRW